MIEFAILVEPAGAAKDPTAKVRSRIAFIENIFAIG